MSFIVFKIEFSLYSSLIKQQIFNLWKIFFHPTKICTLVGEQNNSWIMYIFHDPQNLIFHVIYGSSVKKTLNMMTFHLLFQPVCQKHLTSAAEAVAVSWAMLNFLKSGATNMNMLHVSHYINYCICIRTV